MPLVYLAAMIAVVVPILALGYYSQMVATDAIEDDIASMNLAASHGTSRSVEQDFGHWSDLLVSFAALPVFSQNVKDGDVSGSRDRLEIIVNTYDRLDRAFVTDPKGRLWSDYPAAPESLDKRFDDRDWYKGVSKEWKPYVSGVFRRNAEPTVVVVAIAVPVRDRDSGELTGILVAQVRLEAVTASIQHLALGDSGYIVVLDHYGAVAAHPGLDLQARIYDDLVRPHVHHRW